MHRRSRLSGRENRRQLRFICGSDLRGNLQLVVSPTGAVKTIDSISQASATRRRILIDSGVQGVLVRRTGLYAAATGLYLVIVFVLSDALSHPRESIAESVFRCLDEAVFWAPGLMLLAPLFAYDLIHVSNRFVGPMFRLRRELRKLSNGEMVAPIYSRQGDYWSDASESFNRLRDELVELRGMKLTAANTSDDAINNDVDAAEPSLAE